MNKTNFLLGCCLLCFASCTEISFTEPQPKGIKKFKTFPASLQGMYIIPEEGQIPDTLIITKKYFEVRSNRQNEPNDKGVLSDSLVLKKYKDYYFLNFLEKQKWTLRVFTQQKGGHLVLYNIELSNDSTLAHLKKELRPEQQKDGDNTYYHIYPSPEPGALLKFIKDHYKQEQPFQKLKPNGK
jgi:hypothetical protein